VLISSVVGVVWLSCIFYVKFLSKHRNLQMSDEQILIIAIQAWIGMIILIASDIIISVGLLHLFIKKLLRLTQQRKRDSESSKECNLLPQYVVTIDAMTKYTILNTCAIIVSQIQFICLKLLIVEQLLFLNADMRTDNVMLNPLRFRNAMAVSVFPCDQIINCLVLMMNFRFNETLYWRLCHCLHNCVKRKFIHEIEGGLPSFVQTSKETKDETTELAMESTQYWLTTTTNSEQHARVLHHNVIQPVLHKQSALFSGGDRKDTKFADSEMNFTATIPPNDAESIALWSMDQ